MAGFLSQVSTAAGVLAMAPAQGLLSDPAFTHWITVEGQIIGEAHSVEPAEHGRSFAFVRLFSTPEGADYGYAGTAHLRRKDAQ